MSVSLCDMTSFMSGVGCGASSAVYADIRLMFTRHRIDARKLKSTAYVGEISTRHSALICA